jgi:hypothetical protein
MGRSTTFQFEAEVGIVRDDFPQTVLDVLAKRVGVRCSSPSCRKLTTGPRSDSSRIICIGVGAHITAAAVGGPRFNPALSPEQRRSAENGIWLCQNCGKLVDNDAQRYSVELLNDWKRRAEAAALAEIEGGTRQGSSPEDAAEVELSVGGVPVGVGLAPKPIKRLSDNSGYCFRHDYELCITVRNLGNERLSGYHLDVEFPTEPLERPEAHREYAASRSSRKRAFFRMSGASAPELFPGDGATLLIPYFVDHAIFYGERCGSPEQQAYKQPVRVILHRAGLPPVTVETLFKELSNF